MVEKVDAVIGTLLPKKPGGGGYSSESIGVCLPIFQILTLFQSKQKVIWYTRFETWSLQGRSLARK